MLIFTMPQN